MNIRFVYIACLLITSMIWASCGNQLPLTGGPKDERPPELLIEASTPSGQVRFEEREIKLYFDEYVNLQSPGQQIVISPPLEYSPKIKARLKTVSIQLDEREVLAEDVTYVINFGNSIRDFTEGNQLENYSFVFSTGDYIDSLSVSGIVKDLLTKSPEKDVLVGLYTSFEDSIIYTERPFYFAKTVDGGRFKIKNLRADTFKVVAFADANNNYMYDPLTEKIAFIDTLIHVNDTAEVSLDLALFKEQFPPVYTKYDIVAKGLIKIEFSEEIDSSLITVLDSIRYYEEIEGNTIKLWYAPADRASLQFTTKRNDGLDTIKVRINQRSTDTIKTAFDIATINDYDGLGLFVEDPIILNTNHPIYDTDESKFLLVNIENQDTLSIALESKLPDTKIKLAAEWHTEQDLELTALPGALTDIFGNTNDTIVRFTKTLNKDAFGNIQYTISSNSDQQYFVSLLSSNNTIRSLTVDSSHISFENLPPGKYSLKIVSEDIPNGKWDSGNYLEKRQPEKIETVELEELRSNWTLEESIEIIKDGNLTFYANNTDKPKSHVTAQSYFSTDERAIFGDCSKNNEECSKKELEKFTFDNLKYPLEARENNIEGTVVVAFVVTKKGEVIDPYIIRSLSTECDEAAISMIKKMNNLPIEQRWKPARQKGKLTDIFYYSVIHFILKQ